MIMDMGTQLRVAKAQLSADPEDWCWVRMYRAREGARVRPGLSWGCNPLWDDAYTSEFVGPQILLQPSANRPWTLSPHPGLHAHGAAEWFADGLPASARLPGEFGDGCGGEIWEGRAGIPVSAEVMEVDALVGGGAAEGGLLVPIPAAQIAYMEGGEAEGGQLVPQLGPQTRAIEGGEAEGGSGGTAILRRGGA